MAARTAVLLEGKKILITGPTSQVALPLARELAEKNQVHGMARFSRDEDRARIEELGVRPLQVDLARDSLERVPRDFDYVLHFAVVKSGDFDYDLAANAEGTGRLMSHCREAKGFLFCSSGGVYQYAGARPIAESDPLGDNHRALFPTYSITKIAAETVVRFQETGQALGSLNLDLGRMHELLGRTRVHWRDGIRRLVEARNPELLQSDR